MEEALHNKTVEENSFWAPKGYNEIVDDWFLMSGPAPVLTILAAYLLFVLKLGPDYMKKRQPFQLNNVLLTYNFAQVAFSVFLCVYGSSLLLPQGLIRAVCELDKKTIVPLATGIYFYFSAKASELLDTIFFVLRKKDNQVSFLHVYHHSLMFLVSWYILKYEPTYTLVFVGTLNSFVHVVMYGYYALSTFPSLTKYLWWKKYITTLQLTQFFLIIAQVSANYFISGCPPSPFLLNVVYINTLLMIYLFGDFYIKSYTQKNSKDKASTTKNGAAQTKNSEIKFASGVNNLNGRVHEKTH